jgi:DNA-binding winged helix-turn-helix (wHTH) protein/tetratricopeptide (TPR) repeat protein
MHHPLSSSAVPASPTRTAAPLMRYRFGAFEFDVAKRELRRDGAPVEMPARVFECLAYLIAHRDRAVGRDELLQAVFGRVAVSDGQLAQIVLRARRCVGDDGQGQDVIRTVPRYGFRWVAATQALASDDDGLAMYEGEAVTASLPVAMSDPIPALVQHEVVAAAPGPMPIRRRRSQLMLIAAGMIAAVVAIWSLSSGRDDGPTTPARLATSPASRATLVLPLRVDSAGDATWARLGVMDYLAERLRRAGMSVPPSETTLALLGAQPTTIDRARLRRAAGADLIVSGRAQRVAQGPQRGWRVDLEAEAGDGMRHRASAVGADLLDVAQLACDRLLPALGRSSPAASAHALGLDERLQRVKAAMLGDELDTARRILLAAPPSQLSQPQLRYRLAQIDYRAGDFKAAEIALDDVLAGNEARADPLFRARLLIARGGARYRRNALFEAERDFQAALDALSAVDADLEHGHALNGRAVARSALGRDAQAVADFGAARIRLLRAGDRIGAARVDANLGALEMTRGHPAQAQDYLSSALSVFEQSAAINELQVTRSALSAVHLQRLDPQAALAVADRALQLSPRSPDPTLRLAAHLDRANALVALGRFAEARRVLEDPAIAATTTPAYEQRRAQSLVELARRGGDPRAAVRIADAALADWKRMPGDDLRDWVRLRREQAALAADLPPAAEAAALPTDDEPTVPGLLASALLRDDGSAETGFREALALAERRGAPAEIADVVGAYAPWLIARDRVPEASALIGRIAPWAGRCYDCAQLQLQLADALGDRALRAEAQRGIARLAGERREAAAPVPRRELR